MKTSTINKMSTNQLTAKLTKLNIEIPTDANRTSLIDLLTNFYQEPIMTTAITPYNKAFALRQETGIIEEPFGTPQGIEGNDIIAQVFNTTSSPNARQFRRKLRRIAKAHNLEYTVKDGVYNFPALDIEIKF